MNIIFNRNLPSHFEKSLYNPLKKLGLVSLEGTGQAAPENHIENSI